MWLLILLGVFFFGLVGSAVFGGWDIDKKQAEAAGEKWEVSQESALGCIVWFVVIGIIMAVKACM